MGLFGILVALGLLIWLAYRGWSILLLAPGAALLAAASAREPLLAHWTQTFMGNAAQFLAQFFPLFLLGALFGKLMDDSGSVRAISRFMTERLGPRHAMLAVARGRHGDLWRRQPLRRLLRPGPDGAGAVSRRRDSAPPNACRDCSRNLDLHDVGVAGHACDPERHPHAVLRHDAFAAPGSALSHPPIMLGFGLWWLRARRGYGPARGRGLRRRRGYAFRRCR